jgi:guanylate kinase
MMPRISRRGLMIVLSSPSGAGKTSIVNQLLTQDSSLTMSISATTRPMRPGEVHGREYYFITRHEFEERLEADDFLEHADVFGHAYGTPKQFVFDTLEGGNDIIFDIDWQGTQQISQVSRDDLVTIFILPPSFNELESRLIQRGQDEPEVIATRMNEASAEMSHWAEYHYVVINRDLQQSVECVHAILMAERLRRKRQIGLADFVNQLRSAGGRSH